MNTFACLVCGCNTGDALQSHDCVVYLKTRLTRLEAAVRGLLAYTEQVELLAYDSSEHLLKHDAVLKAEHALAEPQKEDA